MITPKEYQQLASRTECSQEKAQARMSLLMTRINHAAIGLGGDAGEVLACVERHVYYGQPFDRMNMIEELGDCLWYIAQMCNALEVNMEDVMVGNIAKLRKRFPDKFDMEAAKECNRNRDAEMADLEDELTVGSPDLETVRVELTEDTTLECKTCGVDERCTDGDGQHPTLKKLCSGHICPYCSTTISDEVIKQLYTGVRTQGGCPACRGQFVLQFEALTSSKIRLEKLDAKASEEG